MVGENKKTDFTQANPAQFEYQDLGVEEECMTLRTDMLNIDPETVLSLSSLSRMFEVASIREQFAGFGSCQVCSVFSTLYGSGVFCRGCNDAWCDEYEVTGKQLEIEELRFRLSSGGLALTSFLTGYSI